MKLSRIKLLTGLLVALILVLSASTIQWIAYENARTKASALPCNLSPAPYRLEVESFLPPEELLDRAVGHRYNDGELEILVPEKIGSMDPSYKHLTWLLSWKLNDSVSSLRDFLDNGSDEEVQMAFQVVKRYYLMLRLEKEYCRKNLTAVVFRPSPPLKWLLSMKSSAGKLAGSPDFSASLLALSVAFLISALFWLWLFLVSKLSLRGHLRVMVAFVLLILFFGSMIFALNSLLSSGMDDGKSPSSQECDVWHTMDCYSLLFNEAFDHMDSAATCETLDYLRDRLDAQEMGRLEEALGVAYP
ncbi:hypothetical protein [Thermococcus pacificus]|uniref:Uncharacterized protein n=1 Tax=Thermococcus pacificus TaxID=71998 RepID=A0A218P9F7_9EURY|nr:hypothetical protein [Thermococcus pacificus]ASJ07426.1 hypothetical protein A3L08_08885 [Thermococcus pacificus]